MIKVSKTFMKLFLSFTAVLMLPLLCICALQVFMNQGAIEQNTITYQNSLTHSAEMISNTATDIQSLSESVLRNNEVQAFIKTTSVQKQTISDLYVWKESLNNYILSNSNIEGIYLYSFATNWLLSGSSAVQMDETMYNATLSFTSMPYSEWQSFIRRNLLNGFYLMPGGELLHITHYRITSHSSALLILRIDKSLMAEMLRPLTAISGYTALLASDGQIILSLGNAGFLSPGAEAAWCSSYLSGAATPPSSYASFSASVLPSWNLIALLPKSHLYASVNQTSAQILRLTVIMLLIDIVLCLFLSKNSAEPLRRIVSSLSDQIPREYLDNPDEYILIENTIAQLMEKNSTYRLLSDSQRELISFELVRCLLLGEYENLDRLEQLSSHAHISLKNHKFGVIAIQSRAQKNSYQETTAALQKALEPYEARALFFSDRYVILFFLPQDADQTYWTECSHSLCIRLNSIARDQSYQLCVSNLCETTQQIHIAYDETVAMIEIMRADPENSTVEMHFSGVASLLSETYYDYPIDMELQIIHALKMGNTVMLSDLLKEVRLHNYTDRKLSAFMTRQLLFEVRGTVIRGMQSYLTDARIDHHLRAMCLENTLDGLFQHIENLCAEMADILLNESSRRDDHLEERIYSFLSENYTNANLSLENLVEPLGLSERFLYDFIRERFNSTFAKLLEGLRITKACALLRDGEATIKNVASQVGYNSDHTFRLAFKRVMDVTPSEYAAAHVRHKSYSSD